jgi:hypothetical protein
MSHGIHARLLSSKLGLLTLHPSPPGGRSFPRDLTALFSVQLAFPGSTSQLAQMNRVRIPHPMRICGSRSSAAMVGGVNVAERCRAWKSIISDFAATPEVIPKEI